ncbi:hypothetical protein LXL04_019477 [Taraxacum kok-saghyz]
MTRTMQMLDVVEDTEYLEHPNKAFVASACFKGGGAGINEVLKELKRSDARTALFAATQFEPLLRMGNVKGEGHICHMMLLREIKPTWEMIKRWDEARTLRDVMEKRGVKKSPGWSFMEIVGSTHRFIAHDKTHP